MIYVLPLSINALFFRHTASPIWIEFVYSEATPSVGSNTVYSNTMKRQPLDICSIESWFQFYGDGFTIWVPLDFQDIMEPEDYNAGLSLYGDKVKPKTFAAHFASSDGSEVVSVVIRTTNQLKITFLEAKDITDLGSLKAASKLFVPGGADLYSAHVFKIKEDEGFKTYYYYEFGTYGQHIALVASVNSGKARLEVHFVKLGANAWKVWVNVAVEPEAFLFTPNSEMQTIKEAVGSTVAWHKDFISLV